MTDPLVEDTVEQAAIDWLRDLGYTYIHGPQIAPGEPAAERSCYAKVILEGRLKAALARLNPHLPETALDEAFRKVTSLNSPALEENNLAFHRLLIEGVELTVRKDGGDRGDEARLIDFPEPLIPTLALTQCQAIVHQAACGILGLAANPASCRRRTHPGK